MQKSFIEKLQNNNFGKRGYFLAAASLVVIAAIKTLVTPRCQTFLHSQSGRFVYQIINWTDTLAICVFVLFFAALSFFRNKPLGQSLIGAMVTRDSKNFKPRWIIYWLRAILISFLVLAVTTILLQAFYKSWWSFAGLAAIVLLTILFSERVRQRMQR